MGIDDLTGKALEEAAKKVVKDRAPKEGKPARLTFDEWKTLVFFINEERLKKYRNPDPRCSYPFEPIPGGYCWGWANHVDGTEPFSKRTLYQLCSGCDLWRSKKKD